MAVIKLFLVTTLFWMKYWTLYVVLRNMFVKKHMEVMQKLFKVINSDNWINSDSEMVWFHSYLETRKWIVCENDKI